MYVCSSRKEKFEVLAKAGKREEKRREERSCLIWVLAKAGKVKLMFDLSLMHLF